MLISWSMGKSCQIGEGQAEVLNLSLFACPSQDSKHGMFLTWVGPCIRKGLNEKAISRAMINTYLECSASHSRFSLP